MKSFHVFLVSLVLAIATLNTCSAHYKVINHAKSTLGGSRFNKEIGNKYSIFVLRNASTAFWKYFYQNDKDEHKNFQLITLNIQEMKTLATFISSEAQSNIFLNSLYLGKYNGDVKREFTGIIYHEIARVRQWDGNQEAPIGLLTGIADFFRLKAGYESVYWSRVGSGNYWDEGYDVTARFLEYCDDRYYGVVVYLNGWMRYEYKEEYFKDFTGKTADELWNEYKLYYATQG